MELEFDRGRAVVALPGELWLSILSEERNALLQEAYDAEPLARLLGAPWPMARAGDGTFEVALIDAAGRCAGEIPEWASSETEDRATSSHWITYGYVPLAVIEEYVALKRSSSDIA